MENTLSLKGANYNFEIHIPYSISNNANENEQTFCSSRESPINGDTQDPE
jgi:hypothetical protein